MSANPAVAGIPRARRRLLAQPAARAWDDAEDRTALAARLPAITWTALVGLLLVLSGNMVAALGISSLLLCVAAVAIAGLIPWEAVPQRGQVAIPLIAIASLLPLHLALPLFWEAHNDVAVILPMIWVAWHHSKFQLLLSMLLAFVAGAVPVLLNMTAPLAGNFMLATFLIASGAAWMVHAIVERTRREASMENPAYVDAVTGLANRSAWDEELHRRVHSAQRNRLPFSLAMLDLAHFTSYNEDWGHAAGNQLLAGIGKVLRNAESETTRAFRLGDDEFGLILDEQSSGAVLLLTGLLDMLPDGQTFAAGVATWDGTEDASGLHARASRALSQARERSAPKIAVDRAGDRPAEWAETVPLLIAHQSVTAVYQPIRRLDDARTIAFEALARPWGAKADLAVDGMFAAARRLGISGELDTVCQRAAIAGAGELTLDDMLFINIGPGALAKPQETCTQLCQMLGAAGLGPERIVLEISETVSRLSRFADALEVYRTAGFRFAADDVGEGNSALEALAVMRPHFVKVARSLTVNADQPGPAAVIRGLVEFARTLGAEVIAEGIESVRDAERVKALGVTLGQGWALGRPALLSQFRRHRAA